MAPKTRNRRSERRGGRHNRKRPSSTSVCVLQQLAWTLYYIDTKAHNFWDICAGCGTKEGVDLHSSRDVPAAKEWPTNLLPLCPHCKAKIHEWLDLRCRKVPPAQRTQHTRAAFVAVFGQPPSPGGVQPLLANYRGENKQTPMVRVKIAKPEEVPGESNSAH